MEPIFTPSDRRCLLQLAREALEAAVRGQPAPPVDSAGLPEALRQPGACFVTLTCGGHLRGCIGGLSAELPLYEDVRLRAAQAALRDPRFAPVQPAELPGLTVEISVLTSPQPLPYRDAADLVRQLRPGVDGVVLRDGARRATFLPQVWEHVPQPERFLSLLCEKLGVPPDTWRSGRLEVQVYQVIKFDESEFALVPTLDDAPVRTAD